MSPRGTSAQMGMLMFHKRAVRKASGLVMAALLSSAALTGCAVGDGPGADRLSEDPVTIRLTWWGGDKRQQLTQQAVELFERSTRTSTSSWSSPTGPATGTGWRRWLPAATHPT